MSPSKTPALGYALLGLLMKPSSGYDLRKIFSSTSMKTYSGSPGAIYPALRRLQEQGRARHPGNFAPQPRDVFMSGIGGIGDAEEDFELRVPLLGM